MPSFDLDRKDGLNFKNLKGYILWWNNKYPFDRWWRQKHGVAFLSEEHLNCSLIEMRFEYEEDKFFSKLPKERERRLREEEEVRETGRVLRKNVLRSDQNVSDSFFEDLDLSKIGDGGEIEL